MSFAKPNKENIAPVASRSGSHRPAATEVRKEVQYQPEKGTFASLRPRPKLEARIVTIGPKEAKRTSKQLGVISSKQLGVISSKPSIKTSEGSTGSPSKPQPSPSSKSTTGSKKPSSSTTPSFARPTKSSTLKDTPKIIRPPPVKRTVSSSPPSSSTARTSTSVASRRSGTLPLTPKSQKSSPSTTPNIPNHPSRSQSAEAPKESNGSATSVPVPETATAPIVSVVGDHTPSPGPSTVSEAITQPSSSGVVSVREVTESLASSSASQSASKASPSDAVSRISSWKNIEKESPSAPEATVESASLLSLREELQAATYPVRFATAELNYSSFPAEAHLSSGVSGLALNKLARHLTELPQIQEEDEPEEVPYVPIPVLFVPPPQLPEVVDDVKTELSNGSPSTSMGSPAPSSVDLNDVYNQLQHLDQLMKSSTGASRTAGTPQAPSIGGTPPLNSYGVDTRPPSLKRESIQYEDASTTSSSDRRRSSLSVLKSFFSGPFGKRRSAPRPLVLASKATVSTSSESKSKAAKVLAPLTRLFKRNN